MGMTAELPVGNHMHRLISIRRTTGEADHDFRRLALPRPVA